MERFRAEAERLRIADPDAYRTILAHAEGTAQQAAALDPDAYVALFLAAVAHDHSPEGMREAAERYQRGDPSILGLTDEEIEPIERQEQAALFETGDPEPDDEDAGKQEFLVPTTINGCLLERQGEGFKLESTGRLGAEFATFFFVNEDGFAEILATWKKGLFGGRDTGGMPPVRHADAMRMLGLSGFVTEDGREYSFRTWPGLKRTR